MPFSSVSIRARSYSIPTISVMPIAIILFSEFLFSFDSSSRGEAYDDYRYATSSGKTDTHTSFHCHYLPFLSILATHARLFLCQGIDWFGWSGISFLFHNLLFSFFSSPFPSYTMDSIPSNLSMWKKADWWTESFRHGLLLNFQPEDITIYVD